MVEMLPRVGAFNKPKSTIDNLKGRVGDVEPNEGLWLPPNRCVGVDRGISQTVETRRERRAGDAQ